MKKNKALTAAISVLSLTMVSLCAIGGTFAKYASQGSAEDEARVAKWGVTIVATDDGDSKAVLDTLDSNTEAHISVAKELKLLAPGTKGELINVDVTGNPEVAVDVAVDFTLTLDGWEINSVEYMPLVFTAVIGGVTKTYETETLGSVSDLIDELNHDIEEVGIYYAPDANLNTILDLKLSWEWAIGDDSSDANDTALGNLADAPTLDVDYSITITQHD